MTKSAILPRHTIFNTGISEDEQKPVLLFAYHTWKDIGHLHLLRKCMFFYTHSGNMIKSRPLIGRPPKNYDFYLQELEGEAQNPHKLYYKIV